MTNLILVRHGETIWHTENRYADMSDVGLTPHEYEQANWARTAELDAVWVSLLSHTQETAALTARVTGLTQEQEVPPRSRGRDESDAVHVALLVLVVA